MHDDQRTVQVAAPPPKDPESAFGSKSPPKLAPRYLLPESDPPGAQRLGLSTAEIEQFRSQGFVIKRGLIDPQLFAPIMSLYWQQPPMVHAGVDASDPATWIALAGRKSLGYTR